MSKLNLITPPDKLFNDSLSILMIYPSEDLKDNLQDVLKDHAYTPSDINVYVYVQDDHEQDSNWLLSVCELADIIIFDIDNSSPDVRKLASYIIAKSKTYWLTKEVNPVYNILSVKQIYNLNFLTQEGMLSE